MIRMSSFIIIIHVKYYHPSCAAMGIRFSITCPSIRIIQLLNFLVALLFYDQRENFQIAPYNHVGGIPIWKHAWRSLISVVFLLRKPTYPTVVNSDYLLNLSIKLYTIPIGENYVNLCATKNSSDILIAIPNIKENVKTIITGKRHVSRVRIDRSMIGAPTNFRHTGHIGSSDVEMGSSRLHAIHGQMQSKGGYEATIEAN
ncbi:hypothetical protein ACI65C_003213 [Semiaphis heraclei]